LYERATLDTLLFRTVNSQRNITTDNAWVMHDYKSAEDGSTCRSYGRVKTMFMHTAHTGDNAPSGMVVECDWYEFAGVPHQKERNGIPMVSRNYNFDSCRMAFLKDCVPRNCVLWPSYPFESDESPTNGLLDVIMHHE
jgi:hypothetical protein